MREDSWLTAAPSGRHACSASVSEFQYGDSKQDFAVSVGVYKLLIYKVKYRYIHSSINTIHHEDSKMVFRTVLLALLLGTAAAEQSNTTSSQCRCMPSDPCWPTTSEWSHFNSTVGGRLIRTVPLAAPCFDPNYNAAECQYLRDEWTQPALQ